jgi:PAS domain S-box-containing protein
MERLLDSITLLSSCSVLLIYTGYEAKEVIGKNITMLMPERYSVNHHVYLNNYLTSGTRKVIGIGRRVAGLAKDGREFPLHLSISELKEDGEHLFTGIARDLTLEVYKFYLGGRRREKQGN